MTDAADAADATDAVNIGRRQVLQGVFGAAVAAATLTVGRRAQASVCLPTPPQTEGPFYPKEHQLDEDNDLTWVESRSKRAHGAVVYVQGQVTDDSCQPIERALVEIWQACASGRYNHPAEDNPAPLDVNFQYWGRCVSDANGRYVFKTIIPGAYAGDPNWIRPPHIHFTISKRGYTQLTTQMYFAGNIYNATDLVLQKLSRDEQQRVVITGAAAGPGQEATAQVFEFDLRLGAPVRAR